MFRHGAGAADVKIPQLRTILTDNRQGVVLTITFDGQFCHVDKLLERLETILSDSLPVTRSKIENLQPYHLVKLAINTILDDFWQT